MEISRMGHFDSKLLKNVKMESGHGVFPHLFLFLFLVLRHSYPMFITARHGQRVSPYANQRDNDVRTGSRTMWPWNVWINSIWLNLRCGNWQVLHSGCKFCFTFKGFFIKTLLRLPSREWLPNPKWQKRKNNLFISPLTFWCLSPFFAKREANQIQNSLPTVVATQNALQQIVLEKKIAQLGSWKQRTYKGRRWKIARFTFFFISRGK